MMRCNLASILKMFKNFFFAATLLTSHAVFSGPKEDCASMIAKFLFKDEEKKNYEALFTNRLKEKEFVNIFKKYEIAESLKSIYDYLNEKNDDLFEYNQCILAEYIVTEYPAQILSWEKDFKTEAWKIVKTNQDTSLLYKSVKEQELMVQTEPVQKIESNVPSATKLPIEQIKEDINCLDENKLQKLSETFDGKIRSTEQVKRNVDKIFGFLDKNPDLKKLVNTVIPGDTISRINSPEESNSKSSNAVFSGQGVSIGGEEKRSVRHATVQGAFEEEENLDGKPRKIFKEEEEKK
jgi:hypothetical protein